MLKYTVLNKCRISDKWIEFWTDDNHGNEYNMCSKFKYFCQALEDVNMFGLYLNNGCKGIKVTWEKIGPNWEVKYIGFKSGGSL